MDVLPSAPTVADAATPPPAVDAAATLDSRQVRSRWLVFGGTRLVGQTNDQLFAVRLDTDISPLQIIANDVLTAAEWSADGRFLAYAANGGLHVLEPAGASLVSRWNVVPASPDAEPHWSPVAPIVAWTAPASGGVAVHYAAVDRLGEPTIVGGDSAANPLAWSTDGRYLTFEVADAQGGNAPAFADTWQASPVARRLPHAGSTFSIPASSLSLDGKYVEYRGSGATELWVAPLASPDAAVPVSEVVWLASGGFAEIDPDQGARSAHWTGTSWELGPWVIAKPQATYVSSAGFVAGSCGDGFCVGRLSDGQMGTWYKGPLGMSEFSPAGRHLLVQQNLETPITTSAFPAAIHYIDLGGMWGNLTKITEFKSQWNALATTRRWSPTSDAFAIMLEGGTAGVSAWRVGALAETWLALPNPHRYRDSTGAFAPGGYDLAMAWKDDDGLTPDTEVHVFRVDGNQVVAQSALGGVARPSQGFRWHWQP